MVVAWSEISAVKRVVKQLPVENFPAVLRHEQLYANTHYHGEAIHRMSALHHMSALHAYCSKWPYAFLLVFCSTESD